jgi:hypothetical protein
MSEPGAHHAYGPLADMLVEVAQRYSRPVSISESSAERAARLPWFHYVVAEVLEDLQRGLQVEGIYLYPSSTTRMRQWRDVRCRPARPHRGARQATSLQAHGGRIGRAEPETADASA